jgi:amidase
MYRLPEIAEVIAAAERLGITMGAEEAAVYRSGIAAQLREFNAFFESGVDSAEHDQANAARDPGYRPSPDDNPYNAWIWKCHIEGAKEGPLQGKTVGLKDHIPVASIPLTYGSYLMRNFVADFDAPVVTRLLQAGATIVGKCNMDSFSCGGFGFDGVGDFGRVQNPHEPNHLTGGSSSGSAVAVVTRQCDIALGGDQGGSVRIPAAWCGAQGLKPTAGLVPHTGIVGSDISLDRVGPIARTVKDVALTLQAIAGPDGNDLRQVDVPQNYDALAQLGRGVDGVRLGVLEEGIAEPIEPDVRDIFLAAVDTLASHGAHIVRVSVPSHTFALVPYMVLSAEGSRMLHDMRFIPRSSVRYSERLIGELDRAVRSDGDRIPHLLKLRYLVAEFSRDAFRGTLYAKACNARRWFAKAYDDALSTVDALLMPTMTFKPPRHHEETQGLDAVARTIGVYGFSGRYSTVQNTAPFNYTGHPALTVDCGRSAGLPVAMQIVGKHFHEATILRIGEAFESTRPDSVATQATAMNAG